MTAMNTRLPLIALLATPVLVCLLFADVAAPQDKREAKAKQDTKDLQGEWQGTDFQTMGITLRDAKNRRWIFQDDQRIEFNFGSNWFSQESKVRFRLDPSQSPKQIDFVIHWRDPAWKDLTLMGIYSLERERLTICTNNKRKRPTGFKSTRENGNTLATYQRVEGDPSATLAFAKIQSDWAEASPMAVTAGTAAELKRRMAKSAPDPEAFAERYLEFADAHPDGFAGLVALCRAAFLAASQAGQKAISLLEGGRVMRADLDDLSRALDASRTTSPERSAGKVLAPQVLAAVKRQLDRPLRGQNADVGLCDSRQRTIDQCRVCRVGRLDRGALANSPDIGNLCELSGASPTWSAKVERDLRTILDKNQDRAVCAAAAYALASVVQRAGESRQNEAAALFEAFVKKFDGKEQYHYVAIEKMLNENAKRELAELKTRRSASRLPKSKASTWTGAHEALSIPWQSRAAQLLGHLVQALHEDGSA